MKNTLDELYQLQYKSDVVWINFERFRANEDYQDEVVKSRLLEIQGELTELANTFNLSDHRLSRPYDKDNTMIQIVDVLKYLIGLAQLLGITPDELFEAFKDKTDYLIMKWKSEAIEFKKHTKVIIFDLDGVIADHDKGFLEFAMRKLRIESVALAFKSRSSYSYHEYLGVSKSVEEELKAEFIQTGGFVLLPIFPHTVEAVRAAKKKARVVFITAREAHKFKRLYSDTTNWMKNYNIEWDALFWGKDKADAIINGVYPAEILCLVEDRDKHALEVAHLGTKTWLLDKPYNQGIEHKNITRIHGGLKEVTQLIKEL